MDPVGSLPGRVQAAGGICQGRRGRPFRTFFRITLPLAMPGIAVASVFTFLGSLEEAQGTLLVGFPR